MGEFRICPLDAVLLIICLALLLTTTVTLQTIVTPKFISFLSSSVELMQVRPDGFANASHKVLCVEEAKLNDEVKDEPLTTEAQDYDGSDCLLEDYLLEINQMIAKYKVINLFRG